MPLSLSRFPDHPSRSKLRGIHLKITLEDETKMKELILELEGRGYSKAADTLEHFLSDRSLMGLGVSILIDINEEWMTTKKYSSMVRIDLWITAINP